MADEQEIFPGFNRRLETAVHTAVTNALADIDTVSLKRCQENLSKATQELARAQAQAEVWQELAARRKRDIEMMQEQIDNLTTRVAFLESALQNKHAEEVTAGDDE